MTGRRWAVVGGTVGTGVKWIVGSRRDGRIGGDPTAVVVSTAEGQGRAGDQQQRDGRRHREQPTVAVAPPRDGSILVTGGSSSADASAGPATRASVVIVVPVSSCGRCLGLLARRLERRRVGAEPVLDGRVHDVSSWRRSCFMARCRSLRTLPTETDVASATSA